MTASDRSGRITDRVAAIVAEDLAVGRASMAHGPRGSPPSRFSSLPFLTCRVTLYAPSASFDHFVVLFTQAFSLVVLVSAASVPSSWSSLRPSSSGLRRLRGDLQHPLRRPLRRPLRPRPRPRSRFKLVLILARLFSGQRQNRGGSEAESRKSEDADRMPPREETRGQPRRGTTQMTQRTPKDAGRGEDLDAVWADWKTTTTTRPESASKKTCPPAPAAP